jgi:hypothetical protein
MTVCLEDEALAHPNGLYLEQERLVVGSWGQGLRDDLSAEIPGSLLAVDLEIQAISTIVPGLGNLDGVVRIGETLLVSDWITGQLFEIGAHGTHTVIAEYPAGLADIATYDNTQMRPSMLGGHVSVRTHT